MIPSAGSIVPLLHWLFTSHPSLTVVDSPAQSSDGQELIKINPCFNATEADRGVRICGCQGVTMNLYT